MHTMTVEKENMNYDKKHHLLAILVTGNLEIHKTSAFKGLVILNFIYYKKKF